ncbi:hypothetical protein [Spiroplasma endosymbiont of Labia minor]|uniref:hypothetical protein n=1 Tax=Spiroplasma endosymbiont of Labia minor TaxID=3066305 RepID=UPI0030CFA0BA
MINNYDNTRIAKQILIESFNEQIYYLIDIINKVGYSKILDTFVSDCAVVDIAELNKAINKVVNEIKNLELLTRTNNTFDVYKYLKESINSFDAFTDLIGMFKNDNFFELIRVDNSRPEEYIAHLISKKFFEIKSSMPEEILEELGPELRIMFRNSQSNNIWVVLSTAVQFRELNDTILSRVDKRRFIDYPNLFLLISYSAYYINVIANFCLKFAQEIDVDLINIANEYFN